MHFNLVEEGNVYRCLDESMEYYGKVIQKKEEYSPLVGIEALESGEKKSVSSSKLGYIQTTKKHLENLGFTEKTVGNTGFYVLGNIKISSVFIDGVKPIIISGFRLVEDFHPWHKIDEYVNENGEFDYKSFNKNFRELNEINELFKVLTEHEIPLKPLGIILEPLF